MPHVESGLFTFIGATTENPSFEVNSALLSRAAVYVLQPLSVDDLKQIVALAQSQQALRAIEKEAVERLVAYSDGDARRLLNTLETLEMAAQQEQLAEITDAWLLKVLGERMRRYDKGGEQFYDNERERLYFHDTRRTAITNNLRQAEGNNFKLAKVFGLKTTEIEKQKVAMDQDLSGIIRKLQNGEKLTPKEISLLAGHSSTNVTNDTYNADR